MFTLKCTQISSTRKGLLLVSSTCVFQLPWSLFIVDSEFHPFFRVLFPLKGDGLDRISLTLHFHHMEVSPWLRKPAGLPASYDN